MLMWSGGIINGVKEIRDLNNQIIFFFSIYN